MINQEKRMPRLFLLIWFLVISITLNFLFAKVNSHTSNLQEPQFVVKWLGTFSSDSDLIKKNSVLSGLTNLLFGKKEYKLVKPMAVLSLAQNTIFILDQGRRSVMIFDRMNKSVFESPAFPSLISLCINNKSDIFFTDSQLNKIFVKNSHTKKIITLNESLSFNKPTGIAWSQKDQTLWVVETGAHRISILDSSGNLIKRVGRRGAAKGEFNFPTFIWVDQNGLVYVVDSMNFRIQIFDHKGIFISAFGQAGDASGYLGRPKGIATDSYGNIYVVDALFNTVQIFDKTGNFLSYFGCAGKAKGEFRMPTGIYIDNKNRIFVADTYNSRIQMFQISKKEANAE